MLSVATGSWKIVQFFNIYVTNVINAWVIEMSGFRTCTEYSIVCTRDHLFKWTGARFVNPVHSVHTNQTTLIQGLPTGVLDRWGEKTEFGLKVRCRQTWMAKKKISCSSEVSYLCRKRPSPFLIPPLNLWLVDCFSKGSWFGFLAIKQHRIA